MPRVAPSVSEFITSVFSGSSTEPVSRKRTITVVRAMIATTSGACSSRLCFWSMKRAELPETSTVALPGGWRSRISRTASCEAPERAGWERAKFA